MQQTIFREGDVGREMFFIQHGAVNIESDGKILMAMKTGAFFGESKWNANAMSECANEIDQRKKTQKKRREKKRKEI
jgi:hypothetical protein